MLGSVFVVVLGVRWMSFSSQRIWRACIFLPHVVVGVIAGAQLLLLFGDL